MKKITSGEADLNPVSNFLKIFKVAILCTFFLILQGMNGQDSYRLVTSASDLEAGKTYLIVNKNTAGEAAALSDQKTNNRNEATINIVEVGGNIEISTTVATASTEASTPFAITLGEGSQFWTLHDTFNGYLYSASNSKNYLRSRAANSDLNSEWEITIANDGSATIKSTGSNTRNLMRYNSGDNLFSVYGNGQQDVYLYKFVEATTPPAPINYTYQNGTWSPSDPNVTGTTIVDNISIIDGESALTTEINVADLTVLPGAKLNIEGVLNLYGNLTNNGDLVFRSTADVDGQLGHVSPGSAITGEVTVERYMQNRRSYRMVSSPVATTTSIHANWQEGATSRTDDPNPGYGTHITGTKTDQQNGFDGTETGNPSMWIVLDGTQQFEPVSNTDIRTLGIGEAYLMYIRGDRSVNLDDPNPAATATTLRATGELHTAGSVDLDFATVNAGDFAMFGNPYQSSVDINSVFAAASNVNDNHYYVYDSSQGEYGSYVTVSLPVGTATGGSTANQYLQPGQAAQFATAAAGPSALTFTDGTKAPGQKTNTNATGGFNEKNVMDVQLFTTAHYTEGKAPHDGFVMLFDAAYDNAVTLEDALKPMNFKENFGIDNNGNYLSIEKREMPIASEVFQLYSSDYTHSNYTLKFDIKGLEDTVLYLDDSYTGNSTMLEANTVYNFEVNDELSKATDRFSIRVESRLGVTDHALSGIRLFPNPTSNGTFYIHAPQLNGKEISLRVADMAGRQVFANDLVSSSDKVAVDMGSALTTGIYLVTIEYEGEVQTFRMIRN